MKSLLFGLFVMLMCFASVAQTPPVYHEQAVNNHGVVYMRIVNTTPRAVSCWLEDQQTFNSFVVLGNRTSLWYPVYGQYVWYCE